MSRYRLEAAVTNVTLPGGPPPAPGKSILAIVFRDGRIAEQRWVADGTIVEFASDEEFFQFEQTLSPSVSSKNPLFISLPQGAIQHLAEGTYFKLDGDHVLVFNHKWDAKHRRAIND
jgi:hypothetical protein